MTKYKKFYFIPIVITILFLVTYSIIKYVDINKKYPQKEICEFKVGQVISYCGYDFCAKSAEMNGYWGFKEKYNYEDTIGIEPFVEENKTHILLVRITIKNTSNEEKPMPPVYYFTLQNDSGYSTNLDYYLFKAFYNYDLKILQEPLRAKESREITLTYSIDAKYLNNFDGILLNKEDFCLVISLYPKKNYYKF